MKQFIRVDVRLYTDLNRAHRHLYRPELLTTWNQEAPHEGEVVFGGWIHRLETNEREKRLVFRRMEDGAEVEVLTMPCTSRTEYCTHVHLVLHREMTGEEAERERTFYAEILEELRRKINGDWVIKDADLSLSILRGGR